MINPVITESEYVEFRAKIEAAESVLRRLAPHVARIAGREYTGRGFGEGMCVSLRETAASKRKRGA